MSWRVLDRRRFLRSMGLGGAGLFLPSLAGRAQADGRHCPSGPPRRILFVYTHHGTVYDRWRMRPVGRPDDQDWRTTLSDLSEREFSDCLRPLHPWRRRLSVLDGVAMTTAIEEAQPSDNLHVLGHAHSLTGASVTPSDDGAEPQVGRSVDQIIAAGLAEAGRLPSAEFVVGDVEFNQALFSGPRQAVPSEESPQRAFERLFAAVQGGGETQADPLAPAQRSVLDLVARQFDAVMGRVSTEDRIKLEAHRDLVRGVEQRLKFLAELSCDPPDFGSPPAPGDASADAYVAKGRAFGEIIAAAFSCDIVRVATLTLGLQPNELCGAPAGHIHADFAHQIHRDPDAKDVMTRYAQTHAVQFAQILAALDAVPEAGGTLLDHTAVVWVGELGNGLHDFHPWPVVIGGGACGAFPVDAYIHYAQNIVSPNPITPTRIGPAHNKLLVSLCQGMGLPEVTRVGRTRSRTHLGEPIDLTGPLHIPDLG